MVSTLRLEAIGGYKFRSLMAMKVELNPAKIMMKKRKVAKSLLISSRDTKSAICPREQLTMTKMLKASFQVERKFAFLYLRISSFSSFEQ